MNKKERKEMFKKLYVLKDIWFHDIPCFIDCIHSGECYVGKGNLRIIPKDRQIHTRGMARIIAGDGSWVNLDAENLSLVAPPVLVTWRNTKGSKTDEFDFNKAKAIGSLLSNGCTLLLKNKNDHETSVSLDKDGLIKTKQHKSGCNSVDVATIRYYILSNDQENESEWYVI